MFKNWLFGFYLLSSVAWVAWFGSQAYDANRQVARSGGYIQTYVYERRMGNASPYNLGDLVAWQNGQITRFNSAIRTIAEGLAVSTIVFLLLGWLRKRQKPQTHKREGSVLEKRVEEIRNWRSEPASTAFLVISILFFPRIWIIDVTSVSLYWVARLPRF